MVVTHLKTGTRDGCAEPLVPCGITVGGEGFIVRKQQSVFLAEHHLLRKRKLISAEEAGGGGGGCDLLEGSV